MTEHNNTSTVDVMEQRLLAWAAWLKGGRTSVGYPAKNVLHQSWMPPAQGMVPSMRTAHAHNNQREQALHRDIQALGVRLQNTLVVVYLDRAGVDEQLARLDCQPSTVRARVGEAKRLLCAMQGRQAHALQQSS